MAAGRRRRFLREVSSETLAVVALAAPLGLLVGLRLPVVASVASSCALVALAVRLPDVMGEVTRGRGRWRVARLLSHALAAALVAAAAGLPAEAPGAFGESLLAALLLALTPAPRAGRGAAPSPAPVASPELAVEPA